MPEPIYLEVGTKWSFAGSIEWPGWTRHAKGADDPVAALLGCATRYGKVLSGTGLSFDPPASADALDVIEVLEGNSGTEWGVPSVVPDAERRPVSATEADRLVTILQATWTAFDEAVSAAEGYALRTGPRGGGRQLPALIDHCVESDKAYLSKLGSRRGKIPDDDWRAVEADIRERAVEAFRDRAAGRDVREPSRTRELWLPRSYVHYAAWHNLIHAWEIEDRRLEERAGPGRARAERRSLRSARSSSGERCRPGW